MDNMAVDESKTHNGRIAEGTKSFCGHWLVGFVFEPLGDNAIAQAARRADKEHGGPCDGTGNRSQHLRRIDLVPHQNRS